MKRILALALTLPLLLTLVLSFSSCKKDGSGGGLFGKDEGGDAETLVIQAFDGGYGLEYLEAIAAAYTSVYGTKVKIERLYEYSYVDSQLQGGTYVGDLVFNVTNNTKNGAKGYYLNLDDVFNSRATESEILTIAQKLGDKASDYLFDGHYYEMPHAMGYTGVFYNKTSLDTIYAGSSYRLPVTTDELIAMCDDIKAKGTGWGFVHTNSNNAEYYIYLRDILSAQYMGYDAYVHYFDGEYLAADGEWKFADNYSDLSDAWHNARLSALEVCSKIANFDNGYTPKSCKTMDFNEAQAYFWGVTSKTDKRPVAFMCNGDWLYNEIKSMAGAKPADIRMMRTPINSAIIEKLSSVTNDAQLAECVRYVDTLLDGTAGTRPAYLSDADLARLTEARRMVGTTHLQQCASIPYNTRHEAEARDFLRFLASDEACRIYSSHEQGMHSPYSYSIYDEASLNDFTRSVNAVTNNAIACGGRNTRLTVLGGHSYFSYIWFTQKLNTGTSASEILQSFVSTYSAKWEDIKRAAQGGIS